MGLFSDLLRANGHVATKHTKRAAKRAATRAKKTAYRVGMTVFGSRVPAPAQKRRTRAKRTTKRR